MSKLVVVGMSGGVDSSVTAWLLQQQGYQVVGLFMKNWEESDQCPAEKDYADVVSVCDTLKIPHYTVNFSQAYWDRVFSICLAEYAAGYTPNPDILCNREIKFHLFFKKALELGADYLATGHYCRKLPHREGAHTGWALARGSDVEKDQSYFLYTLKESVLARVLFPLGALTKPEVRQLAEQAGLTTAHKKDSTGICFIGKRNFKEFLSKYLKPQPGHFETTQGEIVGHHEGVAFYTMGQRRGLKIGGAGEAWYVVGKDVARHVVIVEQGENHPRLFGTQLLATDISWVGHPPLLPFKCSAKIRYRTPDAPCTLFQHDAHHLAVHFDTPQKAITSRQSIVFYQGELCLGGGMIL